MYNNGVTIVLVWIVVRSSTTRHQTICTSVQTCIACRHWLGPRPRRPVIGLLGNFLYFILIIAFTYVEVIINSQLQFTIDRINSNLYV